VPEEEEISPAGSASGDDGNLSEHRLLEPLKVSAAWPEDTGRIRRRHRLQSDLA
jgi:hypothetical protein